MKPSTRIGADPTFCKLCGDSYWSWGAHAERCVGPRPELLSCECPPGFQHQPDCVIVTGQEKPE
jgi:hypothetical protein